tara:strand:+ start:366 stop:1265 length:900 start_codon:yes stop_codon:yes gene_type:complete
MNFILFFGSFVISWYLYKQNIPILKNFLKDKPILRSSHTITKPTGGGIIFVLLSIIFNLLIFLLGVRNQYLFLFFICLPIAIIGFIDDFKGLKNSIRFLFQILISIILVYYSSLMKLDVNNPILIFILLVIASTSFINFANFIDGLDGLLSGCMLVAFFTLTFSLQVISSQLILLGALFGFFIWNWNPAKIFMGDTGSTFLGALFVGFIYQSKSYNQAFGLVLITAPIFLDCIFCLIRRFLNHENIFKPHKKHTYQRLNQAGLSHSQVSLIYMFGCLFISLGFLIGGSQLAFSIVESSA